MMDVCIYTRDQSHESIEVSDRLYEKLCYTKLSELDYQTYNIIVEEEEYDVKALRLSYKNKVELVHVLEEFLIDEINSISIDSNQNIKEYRQQFGDILVLGKLIKKLQDDDSIYFSYE